LTKELEIEEQSAQETEDMEDNEKEDQPLDAWVDLHERLT
jgi:hypothetical protein